MAKVGIGESEHGGDVINGNNGSRGRGGAIDVRQAPGGWSESGVPTRWRHGTKCGYATSGYWGTYYIYESRTVPKQTRTK